MRMKENWGKGKILKAMMAGCLLFNNFSGLGSIINAAAIEQNEINSLLDGNINEGDSVLDSDTSVDDSNGGNESGEMTPNLPEDGTIEGDSNDSQKPEVDQPEVPEVEVPSEDEQPEVPEVEVPSEDEQPEVPEVEIPSEDEQPEVPEVEVPSEEEAENSDSNLPEDVVETEDSTESDEEGIALEEESELFSLENRSVGSGLVQLWQVVPDGQQSKEGKTTSQIMSALQCRPNHNLYPSGGKTEHNTYVNSCYVDDAFYLGEEGNYYKIYLSGYEGKVPKSESHWFDLDLNGDGKKVSYEIRTVAYYIPGTSTYTINEEETTEILDVPELNYYDQTLDKYNDINEKSVELYANSTVQSPSYYANENGTLIHYVTNNVTRAGSYSKVTAGKAPSWMSSGIKYYSYDGVYFYNNWRNIRVDGQGAINQNNPFYSYYQYLPFRSKSIYSAGVFDNYTNSNGGAGGKLVNTGQYFYAVQNKYGINGALQYSMGIHESGWGKSSLSIDKNNLFGMNATDNNPYGNGTSFPSVEAGINYHADRYLSWGYTDPLSDWRYFGSHVGNKGSGMNVKYASDPFWGEKIAGWYYRFDNANGLKDFDYYTIGIKQSNAVIDVKSQANSSSKTYYQTKNGAANNKISNYPVLITGETNGYYTIKTDTPIINGNAVYSGTYNWNSTYGYVSKNNISHLNNQNFYDPLALGGKVLGLSNIAIRDDKKLAISGYMYLKGVDYSKSSDFSKSFVLEDNKGNIVFEAPLSNAVRTDISNNANHGAGKYNYDYSGYSAAIDLSKFKSVGTYSVKIQLEGSGTKVDEYISLKNDNLFPLIVINADYTYVFKRQDNKLVIRVDRTTMSSVTETMTLDSLNRLRFEGFAFITASNLANETAIDKKLIFETESGKVVYRHGLADTLRKDISKAPKYGANIYNYDYSGYKGTVDFMSKLKEEGTYKVYLDITSDGISKKKALTVPSGWKNAKTVISRDFKYIIDKNENNELTIEVQAQKIGNIVQTNEGISLDANNRLVFTGISFIEGIDISTDNSVTKRLSFKDSNGNKVYNHNLVNVLRKDISDSLDYGATVFNYDYSGYKGTVDFASKLQKEGEYSVFIELTTASHTNSAALVVPKGWKVPSPINKNGYKYTFTSSPDGNLIIKVSKL